MTQAPILAFVDDEPGLHDVVLGGVRAFNATLFAGHPPGLDLSIAVRDPNSNAPIGGLLGRTAGGWLGIELLFVPEALRGMGLATKLVAMAEDEARRRGCHSAWIDTLNPKACDLYRRLGYEVFGALENYPAGNSRVFLRKKLAPNA
jgi:GNAT superfamily N-acetyltransferase